MPLVGDAKPLTLVDQQQEKSMTTNETVFRKVLTVTSNNEYGTPADGALVTLEREAVERILELADVARQYKITMVSETSFDAAWGFIDEDGETFIDTEDAGDRNEDGTMRADGNCLEIYTYGERGSVHWSAYWKHTDVKVTTDAVNIDELREAMAGGRHG
jgi:hypothetical protein